MEGYIHAANQVKEDVAVEYMKEHRCGSYEDVLNESRNGRVVFDNIEIVFRNSAKQKLFSGRMQKKKTDINVDELIPAYLTTTDDESYKDALNSISCSKKLCYFFFVTRYQNFGLQERNKYTDKLRKHENGCPEIAIEIYNCKKQLVNLMDATNPIYADVQPVVTNYLEAIHHMLKAQQEIYIIENSLTKKFIEYLNEQVHEDFFADKSKIDRSKIMGIIQTLRAMKKRGIDIPEIKDTLKSKMVEEIKNELAEHLTFLLSEIDVLSEVMDFINEVIKYIEKPGQAAAMEDKPKNTPVETSMLSDLSSKFAEWIRGG